MNRYEAWIFDLDGVIVDTAHFHFKAWKRLADSLDIRFTEKENEALKGVSREKSLQKILALDDRDLPPEKFQRLMDQKNQWYQELIATLTPEDILDGIPEFLDALKKKGVGLAIGSSSKNAPQILEYIRLTSMFDVVIDGNKVEQTKPHPEVFLKGAKALGAQPEDTIVFEDAASGVEAAKRGGMTAVGVGSEEHLGEADLVISGFKGLTPEKLTAQLNT